MSSRSRAVSVSTDEHLHALPHFRSITYAPQQDNDIDDDDVCGEDDKGSAGCDEASLRQEVHEACGWQILDQQ